MTPMWGPNAEFDPGLVPSVFNAGLPAAGLKNTSLLLRCEETIAGGSSWIRWHSPAAAST